eukprot:1043790_1
MLQGVTKMLQLYRALTKMLHLLIMLFLAQMTPTILLLNKNTHNGRFSMLFYPQRHVSDDLHGPYPTLKACILVDTKSDKRGIHYMKLMKCCDQTTHHVLNQSTAYC